MSTTAPTAIVTTEVTYMEPPKENSISMQRAAALFEHAVPSLARWLDKDGMEVLEAALVHNFRTSPKLGECNPESVIACLHSCAQLNLMPGVAGHIYLIPYGKQCQVQIGYKGMLELGRRSGLIRDMDAGVIYECEQSAPGFRYQKTPAMLVIPGVLGGNHSDDKIVGAYVRVQLTTGGELLHVIDRTEIDARRARGKTKRTDTPWHTDYARMARKSAVKSLFAGGTVPMSPQMQTALQIESIQAVDAAPPTEAPQQAAPTLLGALGMGGEE